ncbi:type II/IV secretion system protein [bacterium]|nr:type II/IV secretion system protein [bacterium]
MDDNSLSEKIKQYQREAQEREAKFLAEKYHLEYLDLSVYPIDPEALKLLEKDVVEKYKIFSIYRTPRKLYFALVDPSVEETQKIIEDFRNKGYQIKVFVVSKWAFDNVLKKYQVGKKERKILTKKIEIEKEFLKDYQNKIKSFEEARQIIDSFLAKREETNRILELILATGINFGASDIHFEPKKQNLLLRYRIDGLLYEIFRLPLEIWRTILLKLKVLSGLKINVTNRAQDGRFSIGLDSENIEVRVSSVPSQYGEMVVLRILDPKMILVDLEDLGFREEDLSLLKKTIKKPNGLILNTGPTGAGKTTTFYAILNFLKSPTKKIITVEDPIEYRLEGIDQTQVNPSSGYTFAGALRSLVRHDPDIILVGEIRDKETAAIATQASLTGHLVLSTLHTNDACGAIPRLVDLEIMPKTIASSLSLVIAQRLVRRVCLKCSQEMTPTEEELKKIKKVLGEEEFKKIKEKGIKIKKPKGCKECRFLGYKGRIGIFELFLIDEDFQLQIEKDSSYLSILNLFKKKNLKSLTKDGVLKVLEGITTLDEVERVCGVI